MAPSPAGRRVPPYASVFELAAAMPLPLPTAAGDGAALSRLFEIEVVGTHCAQPAGLAAKYGAPASQPVVSITNRATLEQTWYNQVRTLKPQTFKSGEAEPEDPTAGGRGCDFCDARTLTAEDVFGRVERPTCMTASNLFKYCAPYHGLVVFKAHNPLEVELRGVADLMSCAAEWFSRAAAAAGSRPVYPFLLWNCLARAGASQYHGHAQLLASHTPIPQVARLDMVAQLWPRYYLDVLQAHRAAGLLCGCGEGADRAWAYVYLAPIKDMEIIIHARSLRSAGLHRLLHAALRTLIDDLGAVTFNVGVLNIQVEDGREGEAEACRAIADGVDDPPPVVARIVSRGKLSSKASDFGALEVFGGASIGHTDPYGIMPLLLARLGPSNAIDPAALL
eukprot:jgi/Tetstr1/437484/TSEL_026163.t1